MNNYPCVRIKNKPSVKNVRITFNAEMNRMFEMTGYEHVRFELTPKLLIIRPSLAGHKLAHKNYQTYVYCSALYGRGIRDGRYRVYKLSDCFAIKRYEPLPEGDDGY